MTAQSGHRVSATHDTGLAEAVAAVIRTTLPGQPPAPRSALDAVIGARLASAPSATHSSAAYTVALAWSWLHSGQAAEAADLADRRGMVALQRAAGQASPATQSACYSVLGEVYFLNGRLRDCVACLRIALDYAAEAHDLACEYRARGLLALALAKSGEITEAAEEASSAEALDPQGTWANDHASWPLHLARIMVMSRRLDAEGIARLSAVVARTAHDDVVSRAASRLADVLLQSARQDNRQIVASARRLARGPDARHYPPLLMDLALSLESLAHVHLGDPAAALNAVEHRVSPPDHSVCFELNRATAYLQLGQLRRALQVTDACVRCTPDHTLGTLASVQLRRALAYEGLGMPDLADAEYSKASHLAYELGMVSAAIGLALPILERLYRRLHDNEPEFARQLDPYLPPNYAYPDRPDLGFVPPQLTPREGVLAGWLMTELSLPAIAAELHVSVNTVKTQAKSLYAKLGASSRDEAVLKLERTGLYAPPESHRDDTSSTSARQSG